MSRPRLHADAAAKQRAYRDRIKARRRAQQGPTEAELARAVRDLHIRMEYEAAINPGGTASSLVGRNSLETLRNTVTRIIEQL
jgi:hypothetical protein